jgi:hypothetical protein
LTSLEGEEDQEAQQAQQQVQQEVLEWPHCMDDLGGSNKLCSEALERVIWACPGSAQLLWGNTGSGAGGGARPVSHSSRDSFLPFLP